MSAGLSLVLFFARRAHGARASFTLTAHGQLGKCLASAFQDGQSFRRRFVSAQDDLDVEWIKLKPAAMRPVLSQAMSVDPEPRKGSMTMSPTSQNPKLLMAVATSRRLAALILRMLRAGTTRSAGAHSINASFGTGSLRVGRGGR